MTCIVGFTDGKTSWLGGDSLGSNGYSKQVFNNKKVFKLDCSDNIVSGYTTSFRMGQLIQYSSSLFDEVNIIKDNIDEKYMVNKFIPNLQKLLSEGGFEQVNNSVKSGGSFIIAIKGSLFEVQDDYAVLTPQDGFCSVGCGYYYANASMYTTKNENYSPIERITKALEAAEHFSVGVQRPFYIINTENNLVEVIE